MADRENVMISSTMLDLPAHRERVRDACLQQGMYPLMMEYLPASADVAIQKSLELVNQADIYVGVFAHRYGFVPPGQTTSITEIEDDRAVERRINRLIFIMGEDHEIKILALRLGRCGHCRELTQDTLAKTTSG